MYMDMIALVLPVWCTDASVDEQVEKIIEESKEVEEVVKFDDVRGYNMELLVDECLDTIQASLNLIYKVYPECHLQEAIMRNLMKNKRRGYIPQS